jgi:hypothetical protein
MSQRLLLVAFALFALLEAQLKRSDIREAHIATVATNRA